MTPSLAPKMTLEQAFDIARQQMQSGNFRIAEMAFCDILAAAPDHFNSLHFLGLARYYLGNIHDAIETLQKAANHPNATAECWTNLGGLLLHGGHVTKALESFDRALAIDSGFAPAWWNKSNALWVSRRFEDAEKAGQAAVEKAPQSPDAWNNLGMAQAGLGKTGDAIECWRKAVGINPGFSAAWNNLAHALRESGNLPEAKNCGEKAVDLDPRNTHALNNLANIRLDLGETEKAEDLYKRALAEKPDFAEAHNNLALCLILQGRYEEAVSAARFAALFKKDFAEAHMNTGSALRSLGRLDEAEKALQQASTLAPASAEVRIELAETLIALERYPDADIVLSSVPQAGLSTPRHWLKFSAALERLNKSAEALDAAQKATDLAPAQPEGPIRKGQIHHLNGDTDRALSCYQAALALSPDMPALHVALAELFQTTGEMDKARAALERAQALDPAMPEIYTSLVKLKKFMPGDTDFQRLRALEKEASRHPPETQAALHFALFSAFDHAGDCKTAFGHLQKANALKRSVTPYHHEKQAASLLAIRESHAALSGQVFKDRGFSSPIPVFIIGMPRSGTTLTEQIMAAHPDVFAAGEIHDFSTAALEMGGALTPDNASSIGGRYVEKIQKRDPTGRALRITNKMPGNFMHLGQIALCLPEAKVIHCRRDPMDTIFSCYKQNFARGHGWSYDLDDAKAYYGIYDELMSYWREALPGRFLEIDYEETVTNFEAQARKIIGHIGLEWNDACLRPHEHKRAVLTASKTQVVKPVYASSVGGWKKYEEWLHETASQL